MTLPQASAGRLGLEKLNFQNTFIGELPIDEVNLFYVNPNTNPYAIDKYEFVEAVKRKYKTSKKNENKHANESVCFLNEGLETDSIEKRLSSVDIHGKLQIDRLSNKVKSEAVRNQKPRLGCFSLVLPEPMPLPRLVHYSKGCLEILDLDPEEPIKPESKFTRYLVGSEILPGTYPWAQCYAGHQFGHFAGRLGDGRAMSLAEIVNSKGERWELQLKGSGETPYSRMGDGFAVLRSSVREYLGSEASAALGIPTTRALSLIHTAQLVHREQVEDGAVVARLAPSWLRFGSFELFRMSGDAESLGILADYVLRYHFPHIQGKSKYSSLYNEIASRTGALVAHWQSTGFCHGVLNTDNMSILGLTLDYGPFGFLDKFDPTWTPNLSDTTSRYSYQAQPEIGAWNIVKLGEALSPLLAQEAGSLKSIHEAVEQYFDSYETEYHTLMSKKLGLVWKETDKEQILNPLLKLLEVCHLDYHIFFRSLGEISNYIIEQKSEITSTHPAAAMLIAKIFPGPNSLSYSQEALSLASTHSDWISWLKNYAIRLAEDNSEDVPSKKMSKANPRFVLRNWIAQEVISALQETPSNRAPLQEVYDFVVSFPFADDEQIDWASYPHLSKESASRYASKVPPQADGIKCSCSS
ncbi:hypothetical protein DSO57_1014396 [Entomophthora muscae]|uniref:Uncharacterized protein n=1 Tax=Entomophthora muscae TaxID=34485 RepID=A0ACC2TGB6_9FUNG|nr:hypothetical protein DSO57_1014396 [Entomophthora muscae]